MFASVRALATVRMLATILVLAATLAALGPASALRPAAAQADLESLAAAVRDGACAPVLPALQAAAAGQELQARRAQFLLGVCLAQLDRHAEAAAAFRGAALHPALGGYARLREAHALLSAGAAGDAHRLFGEVAAHAAGPLRGRALAGMAAAASALRRPGDALAALRAAVALRPDDPDIWLDLGRIAAVQGRRDVAAQAFARVAFVHRDHPQAGEARAAAAQVLGRALRSGDADPAARLLRGRRLAPEGLWEEAAAEFRAAAASGDRRVAGEAAYRLGGVLVQSGGDPGEAYRAFRRAAALGWEPDGAWYRAMLAAQRAGLGPQAREARAAFLRAAPRGPWAARYWFALGRRAEAAGRDADAAAHYRRAGEAEPASNEAVEARWRTGWLALQAGRAADAAARFRAAGEAAPWRSEAARAWYWAAKALEATRDASQAAEAQRIVRMVAEAYPLTFYGQRARARLGLSPVQVPPSLPHALPWNAAGPLHEELAALRLDEEALEEAEARAGLRPDPRGLAPSPQALRTPDPRLSRFLALMHARAGRIPESVAHAEDALQRGVRDETTWRLAYPRAFWPQVAAAAQAAGIDPLLLLALVREESRYDARVLSPARAVGLTQLLPATARAAVSDASLTVERLKDPATNLAIGARYLRLQLDRFGGDVRLALAAYNAGPGAASRWVDLDPDPDYVVERIGFAETRAYIRRVMGAYGVYRIVWGR